MPCHNNTAVRRPQYPSEPGQNWGRTMPPSGPKPPRSNSAPSQGQYSRSAGRPKGLCTAAAPWFLPNVRDTYLSLMSPHYLFWPICTSLYSRVRRNTSKSAHRFPRKILLFAPYSRDIPGLPPEPGGTPDLCLNEKAACGITPAGGRLTVQYDMTGFDHMRL